MRWSPWLVAPTSRRGPGRRRGVSSPSSSPEASASDSSTDPSGPRGLGGCRRPLFASPGPPPTEAPARLRGTFSVSSGGTSDPGRSRVERSTGASETTGGVTSNPPGPLPAKSRSSTWSVTTADPSPFRPRTPSVSSRRRARRVRGRLPSSSEELPSPSAWPCGCRLLPSPQVSRTEELSWSKTGSWLGRGDGGFLGGRPRFRLGGDVEMARLATVLATLAVGRARSDGMGGGDGGGGGGGGGGSGCVRLSASPSPVEAAVPGAGASRALGGRPRLFFSTGERMMGLGL